MNDTFAAALAEFQAEQTPSTVSRTAGGYGVDLICFDDFTPRADDTKADSIDSLRQDSYHRIITARGTLPTDPDVADEDEREYGFDIFSLLHKGRTNAELRAVESQIEDQLSKDDRIAETSVTVTVTPTVTGCPITVKCIITPAAYLSDRPFELIIVLDATGVATLVPQ